MQSTHTGDLDLPMLRPAAHAHRVPALHNCSLLSIGTVCDAGYTVEFTTTTITILDKGKSILTGCRHRATGMWHISLSPVPIQFVNRLGDPTIGELVQYTHATLFSPALSTIEAALAKGFITNFPGLSLQSLRKHPPKSTATTKGHMDQSRKNVRSTKPIPTPDPPHSPVDDDHDCHHPSPAPEKSHHCYAAFIEPTGQIYSDQTGRFVLPSSTGNNYLMIVYDYDSNHIFAQPFANRTAKCLLTAFKKLHQRLCDAGLKPSLQRLDNECSTMLKEFMKQEQIDFQLVPPGVHRRNAAERAIRTFQNHFIAGLCSVDKDFPIHLWDQLVPQAEITLNLLRSSRINPKLLAHAQVSGQFDFNRTPLGPPGCRVIAHVKPTDRTTWSPHGLDGWYVGPALESYRCYNVWIIDTLATRICDTVSWFPTKVTTPDSSSNAMILSALHDILHALKNPSPKSPIAPLTDAHTTAIVAMNDLLNNIATDASPLRVPIAPLPVPSKHSSSAPVDPATTPTTQAATTATPKSSTSPVAPSAPSLRVPRYSGNNNNDPTESPPGQPTTQPTVNPPVAPTVTFAPTNQPTNTTTYDAVTGPKGRKRRRARRRNKTNVTPRRSPRTIHKAANVATASTPENPILNPCNMPYDGRMLDEIYEDNGWGYHGFTMNPPPPPVPEMTTDSPDFFTYQCMHGTAVHPDTGVIAEYKALSESSDGPAWIESNDEEIGRMFQGLGPDSKMPKGTETLFFIDRSQIPKNKKPTYIRVVCADRPEKANPKNVRWTAGGDRIDYPGNKTCKTADITTAKLMFNSVISTPTARFMGLDLKDFYLCSTLDEYEYVRIPVHMLSQKIIELYALSDKIIDDHVYAEVRKGMYGLPQAGRLANEQLREFLAPHGYIPCPVTPGLWTDTNSDLMFTLVVDDFGVRYTTKASVDKLVSILKLKYACTEDWVGDRYVGLTLEWDYIKRTCKISMPGYIARALQRFEHLIPVFLQHSPHEWTAPIYGSRQQYVTHIQSPLLDVKDVKFVQEVLGTLLYYGRAVDNTIVTAIGSIATEQSCATKHTMLAIIQLLNYVASHPDATVCYYASDMILYVDSDASYLSVTKARSRAAGFHYLSDKVTDPTKDMPPLNGAINVPCKILKEVLSSAAEAELAALFLNAKEAVPERITLEELGHPQGPTPMVTDNNTASGIANDSIKQKRSKAMDMHFYWVRDRVRQGQFLVFWRRGVTNKADYHTKHHPPKVHVRARPVYLHTDSSNRFAPLSDYIPEKIAKNKATTGKGVLIPSARRARAGSRRTSNAAVSNE